MTLITLASTARRFRCCIICQTFARHFMTSQVTVSFIFPIIYFLFIIFNDQRQKLDAQCSIWTSEIRFFIIFSLRTLQSKKNSPDEHHKSGNKHFFDSMKCYLPFEFWIFQHFRLRDWWESSVPGTTFLWATLNRPGASCKSCCVNYSHYAHKNDQERSSNSGNERNDLSVFTSKNGSNQE